MKFFGLRNSIFHRFRFLEPIALVWVLAFVFYMGFLPKDDYRYPLHVDEWFHYTYARSTLETGRITFENPYYGNRGYVERQREAGFHVLLAELKLVSGISWITLFRFMPAMVLVATAFLVYALGRSKGFGLEGAILVSLLPTTLRLMGLNFLVPLGVGLFLTPAFLFLYYRFEFSVRSTLLLGLLLLFLLMAHPATGVIHLLLFVINMTVFVLWASPPRNVRLRRASVALAIGGVAGVAVVALLGTELAKAYSQLTSGFSPALTPPVRDIVSILGLAPFFMGAAGVVLWTLSKSWVPYAIGASQLCCLILFTLYSQWRLGEQSVGDRGIMMFFLLLAITGAAGLATLRDLLARLPWRAGQWAPLVSGLALAVVILTTIPMRKSQELYYLINDPVYYDAVWIDQYVDDRWKRMMSNPIFAVALPPLTGKTIYASSSDPVRSGPDFLFNAERFLSAGMNYTWMTEKDVGLAVAYVRKQDGEVNDQGLNQPRPGVYLLQRLP